MPDQPSVFDEDTGAYVHGAAVANPASPSGTYTQAEAVAVRDAVVSILAALRSRGIIAKD